MIYTRTLAWLYVIGLFIILTGCSPAPQAEGQLPLARPHDQVWTFVPMTSGPGLHTACVKGDRLYVLHNLAWRGSEWTGAHTGSLAVAAGACK